MELGNFSTKSITIKEKFFVLNFSSFVVIKKPSLLQLFKSKIKNLQSKIIDA